VVVWMSGGEDDESEIYNNNGACQNIIPTLSTTYL